MFVSNYLMLMLHMYITASRYVRSMVLQLTLLGYVLVPVVAWGTWWLVLLTSAAMVAVNSIEAVSRPAFTYKVSFMLGCLILFRLSGPVLPSAYIM
jgi:ABC-type iron transport system FetAB permease component